MRGKLRERILRVLFEAKDESLSKMEISKRAECSRPWVIAFLKELENKRLVKGTRIVNKTTLLNYWVDIANKPKKHRDYMVKEPLELLKKAEMEYALTTYQAENIVQHYLFPSRIDLYIKEKDMDKWHALIMKNGLYGKGNVKLIIADDEQVMYGKRVINSLKIVSIPQLIVDLKNEGGPCVEAAQMLIKRL